MWCAGNWRTSAIRRDFPSHLRPSRPLFLSRAKNYFDKWYQNSREPLQHRRQKCLLSLGLRVVKRRNRPGNSVERRLFRAQQIRIQGQGLADQGNRSWRYFELSRNAGSPPEVRSFDELRPNDGEEGRCLQRREIVPNGAADFAGQNDQRNHGRARSSHGREDRSVTCRWPPIVIAFCSRPL